MSTLKLNGATNGSSILKAPDTGSTGQIFTLPASTGTLAKTSDITSVGGATGVDFNDNVAARWGTGNDLSISTNGSNSYINNTGSGDLLIRGNDVKIQGTTSSESMAHFVEDGGVELYHNNVKKLETTSAGGTLTGTWTGAGKILQVTNTSTGSNGSIAYNSTSYVNSGFITGNITPVATGSSFFVSFSGFIPHVNPSNGNYGVRWKVYYNVAGGSFSATSSEVDGATHSTRTTAGWSDYNGNTEVYHSPSYTSGQALQYKLYTANSVNNTGHSYLNHMGGALSGVSGRRKVTIFEIAG